MLNKSAQNFHDQRKLIENQRTLGRGDGDADADADYPDAAVDNSRDGAGRKATNKRQPELSAPVGDSGDERKAKRVGGFDLDGRDSFSIPAEKSTTERFAIDGGSYLGKTNFSKTNVSRGNAEKDNAEKENAG